VSTGEEMNRLERRLRDANDQCMKVKLR
jgi:hypothetical protein